MELSITNVLFVTLGFLLIIGLLHFGIEFLIKYYEKEINKFKQTTFYTKLTESIQVIVFVGIIALIFWSWISQCSNPSVKHGAEQEYPY
jgi:hypothetical protein